MVNWSINGGILSRNRLLKNLLLILFTFFNIIASAAKYYVSSAGNDANNGLSSSTPWKTIAKVNSKSFLPGDIIYFNKGEIWRETLIVPSSGKSGASITFSSYGTGVDPIISGSDMDISWSRYTANIWQSTVTTQPTIVYFNNKRGTLRANSSCSAEYEWYWAGNILYVYAPSDYNPSITYTSPGVEVGHRSRAMQTNNKEYITFNRITFRDGNSLSNPCVYVGTTIVNGFVMQYCTIERSTFSGINLLGSSTAANATVDHCTINDNGSYGVIVSNLYATANISNNIIENNGWGSVRDNAPASGIAGFLGNINIFGNTIFNNGPSPSYNPSQSHGIYVSSSTSAAANIYNNTIYGQTNGSGIKARWSANIYRNLIYQNNSSGIEFGGNDATAVTYNIYYNIIRSSITGSGAGITNGLNGTAHIILQNNVFYKDGTNAIELSLQNNVPYLTIKNNIFYAADGRRAIDMVLQTGVHDIDYNLYWQDTQSGNPNFKYNNASPSWTQWQAFGFDAHGINANPLFVSNSDFHLKAGSSAIGAGTTVGLITDYDGAPVGNTPDIGAFEIQTANSIVIPQYKSSVVENATPASLEITYNTGLANIVPAVSAFTVTVNSEFRPVSSVAISGTKILLTLAVPIVSGDEVTVAYTKPAINSLQTTEGAQVLTFGNLQVVNNCINIAPVISITSPLNNNSFASTSDITITANATDPDGSISSVEFYNGSTKIGTATSAPYSFTWNDVAAGTYSLTVVATDNLNSKVRSSAVSITLSDNNLPPVVKITNPDKGGDKFKNNANITIDVFASDPDGTISSVSLFNGSNLLVQLTSAPYSFIWKYVAAGTYAITAVATDNLNGTSTSAPIDFIVENDSVTNANSELIKLYPNPNDGYVSIEFVNPLKNEKSNLVVTDLTGKQIYSNTLLSSESIQQIDLSDKKPGFYILRIRDKDILVTKKFIIH